MIIISLLNFNSTIQSQCFVPIHHSQKQCFRPHGNMQSLTASCCLLLLFALIKQVIAKQQLRPRLRYKTGKLEARGVDLWETSLGCWVRAAILVLMCERKSGYFFPFHDKWRHFKVALLLSKKIVLCNIHLRIKLDNKTKRKKSREKSVGALLTGCLWLVTEPESNLK